MAVLWSVVKTGLDGLGRHAAPVVLDADPTLGFDVDADARRGAGEELIEAVPNHLLHHVVQPPRTSRADVHARAPADRLHSLEHLELRARDGGLVGGRDEERASGVPAGGPRRARSHRVQKRGWRLIAMFADVVSEQSRCDVEHSVAGNEDRAVAGRGHLIRAAEIAGVRPCRSARRAPAQVVEVREEAVLDGAAREVMAAGQPADCAKVVPLAGEGGAGLEVFEVRHDVVIPSLE